MEVTYGQTLLSIEHLSLEYDGHIVLKDVNAEIKDIREVGVTRGQITGFIGPSGIGKTSLLMLLSGLQAPSSGKVTLNGNTTPIQPGQVGMVAQNYPLFEHRTVYRNLMIAAGKKYQDKEARDKVLYYLNEFDLSTEMNYYPSQLSGGQRQRVAIIQQILCSNHFILLDEPFSGLDLMNVEKASGLIRKIADLDDLNTMVIVSHDISSVSAISDHLWLLGRNSDARGNKIPGASIVKTYDLIERDLAYHADLTNTPEFLSFVNEVKTEFRLL